MPAKTVTPVESLSAFRINDTSPFYGEPHEIAFDLLVEAHALTLSLNSLIIDAADEGRNSIAIRPNHLAGSIEAIGSLIALSAWISETSQARGA